MKQRMNDAVKLPPTGPLTQDQTEMTEGPSAVAKEPNAKVRSMMLSRSGGTISQLDRDGNTAQVSR